MAEFSKKVEEASSRLNQTIAETVARLEKETNELVKHLNDEVVPTVRAHSSRALRTASETLSRLADHMEKHTPVSK